MEFWMFDVKFCPAFAGHANAWILEEIAHAKAAKDGKFISKCEIRPAVAGHAHAWNLEKGNSKGGRGKGAG